MSLEAKCVFCFVNQNTAYEMRISDWSSDVCSSDLDGGAATGLSLFSGASQAVVLTDGLNVTGTGAIGAQLIGTLGAVALTSEGAFTVDGGAGYAFGTMARGGTTQTLSFEQALNVTGSGATGIDLAGGSSAVAVTLADALTVQGGVNGATGIFLGDGTTQVLDLAGPVNIQSNGGLATGVRSGNSSGNVQIVSRDTLSVTNSDGGAVAVSVAGDAGGAVELAGAVTVAGSDDAVGVQIAGAGALSLTSAQDFTVTSSEGEATGAAMIGGTSQASAFTGEVAITGADVRPGSVSWVPRAP